MFIKTLTVSDISKYIKKTFDSDFILSNINVKGEISNLKIHSSGHIYFSLKDNLSKINCVMFKRNAVGLEFIPEDGMKVVAKGSVSVYEKEGIYQLYCDEIKQDGLGELYLEFQKLKNKLHAQGLFDEAHKKYIPIYPRRIGVVTSPTGAAIRDIINVSIRRNTNVQLLIYPSLVQGKDAPANIIEGIRMLNKVEDVDVIILARGGGSIEELWAFNDEDLAYEIYDSYKPIITGIGHETDFTIADFVSDSRASTPSAAAELAVPLLEEINNKILSYREILNKNVLNYIDNKYYEVDLLTRSLTMLAPGNYIIAQYERIDNLKNMIYNSFKSKLLIEKTRLSKQYSLLNAHNPLNILNKGYSIIQDDKGNVLYEVNHFLDTEEVNITVKNGAVKANLNVLEVKNDT
ncbi:exodeoxyribonuclease 7 large subunit [Clostridium tepidiprofundi DSM 19306]|uniref:Exodeoxyribonuclease 7 large subunit n=1 Tax=Clostridium tepidiprofundi DSM 19306 TaxID=1121338 RepID=A0A151B712_9CLOT|nr:exodeoxyribonuclease VII large subunit [Clostridium tepidiprofundi]KYH35696.1 exodeoxyribonuclease 7 large subunit [Clostridium tepidiprofundi DSM 19306]